ncbi:MAG: ABC transporter ATP-binding protein [Alistipes sp.]
METSLFDIIPHQFRKRGIWVTCTIFMRALLNFLGLALLLPVLLLILDTDSIHTTPPLQKLYQIGGFSDDQSFVIAICLGIVLIITIKCLLNLWLYRSERNYINDLYQYISRKLYISYHDRGLSFIKSTNSAVLSRNVNVVCLTFVAGVLRPIASMASDAMLFLMLFGALALYNPLASGLIILIFMPSIWFYYSLVRRRLNRYGDQENQAHREKARTVAETFRGYADIEISNAFPMMLRRFDQAMKEVIDVQTKNATINMLPQSFTEIGLALGMALLIILSLGGEAMQMRLLFGIFAVAALRLMPSVRSIMSSWSAFKYNRYTIDILREANFDAVENSVANNNSKLSFEQKIDVDHLCFYFADGPVSQEVIHDLSFSIRKGERIGIRGASGAGKTTLFNLLLGFYQSTAGSICIDGTPLTADNRRCWQNAVGYVSQTVFLTDNTLAANVALGVPDEEIDRDRVIQALEMASLGTFTATLSKHIDTPIGECGCRLSGGQRQRIGIARALYKQANILFFDEATSSLDNRTEESINQSVAHLSQTNTELTIVVIAHRESSLEYCDRIITIGND